MALMSKNILKTGHDVYFKEERFPENFKFKKVKNKQNAYLIKIHLEILRLEM